MTVIRKLIYNSKTFWYFLLLFKMYFSLYLAGTPIITKNMSAREPSECVMYIFNQQQPKKMTEDSIAYVYN